MSVKIVKAGILDTVQDSGRIGYARWGINPNGAMDPFAMAVSNALVGNETNLAVFELHFPAAEFLFQHRALISLTGADFSPTLNGHPIPLWRTIEVGAASVLKFTRKQKGMRCYLSIHGGLDIPNWLGSLSTNLKAE